MIGPYYGYFTQEHPKNTFNNIQKRVLRVTPDKKIDSFVKVLSRPQGITNHYQNIQILMAELFKVVNNLSPPISDSFLRTIRGKHYNLRGFENVLIEERQEQTVMVLKPILREKCPNTELFLFRIFLYSN